jgi:hypothetical protein
MFMLACDCIGIPITWSLPRMSSPFMEVETSGWKRFILGAHKTLDSLLLDGTDIE